MTTNDRQDGPKGGATGLRPGADLAALAAIGAIGVLLRLVYLDVPMRYDESYTFNEYASGSPYDAISLYTFPNNHLLHSLLVHVAVGLFGDAPQVVRLPAMLAGLAMIPASYEMVRRLAGSRAAALTAAMVAASGPMVGYSVDGRGYTLLCLITVLLVAAASRIREGGTWADWAAFAVLPALGSFTIPVMIYPHAGVTAWLLIGRIMGRVRGPRIDRLVVALLTSGGLTVILYLPTALRVGVGAVVANPFVEPMPRGEVVRGLPALLADVWRQWHRDIPAVLVVAFVVVWVAALIVPTRGRGGVRRVSGLVLVMLGCSIVAVLVQRVLPFPRVWLFLLPLYQGMIASGMGTLIGRGLEGRSARAWRMAAVLPVLLAMGLGAMVVRGGSVRQEAWNQALIHGDEIAVRLRSALGPDDAVIAELPCEAPLKYHFLSIGMPVEPLLDYRIARARRLFIVVSRANGQTPKSVLAYNRVDAPADRTPRLVEDFGRSALYELVR